MKNDLSQIGEIYASRTAPPELKSNIESYSGWTLKIFFNISPISPLIIGVEKVGKEWPSFRSIVTKAWDLRRSIHKRSYDSSYVRRSYDIDITRSISYVRQTLVNSHPGAKYSSDGARHATDVRKTRGLMSKQNRTHAFDIFRSDISEISTLGAPRRWAYFIPNLVHFDTPKYQ